MTDAQYAAKFQEMQKYVPFIQRVIEKLKVNNEQADNPRKAQLQKMEMLHDLLTNKAKKIKMETLQKCEGVLIKLHAKIEKQTTLLQNEDSLLNNIRLKQQTSSKPSTNTSENAKVQEIEDISGPASPPPEVIPDDIDQPVVIPTERRCSPILVKENVKNLPENKPQHSKHIPDSQRTRDVQNSGSEHFQSLRQKVFSSDSNEGDGSSNKQIHNYHHQHHRKPRDSRQDGSHNAKEHQHHHSKHLGAPNRQDSPLLKDKPVATNKSHAPAQTLQTVKVVITEPLPAHVKQQHFPSSNKFLPRASICHSNLKTLPQLSQSRDDHNEAYSPEELWDQYNESHKKHPTNNSSNSPVFSRLGTKVPENSKADSSAINKASGRYTPIPDVLKSPPLSASDINNLLLESGADRITNDISEIGCRRPAKIEELSSNNSFEFVRKKLAHTARINSPLPETQKLHSDRDGRNVSPLPHERIALKYNPHPRQERLQSISSTDGSECSTQSKVNDPRIKLKLQSNSSLNSPNQVAASNVNVLPAINLNDPRLKRQNTVPLLPTPPGRKTLLTTPPALTSTPIIGFTNPNPMCYGSRKDPRIARVPSNPATRRPFGNQPQYSSEENWDSDPEEKTQMLSNPDPRLLKKDHEPREEQRFENNSRNSFSKNAPNKRIGTSQPRFSLNSGTDKVAITEPVKPNSTLILAEENWDSDTETHAFKTNVEIKDTQHKTNIINKEKHQFNTNNFMCPVVPKPPKSDTEEDWDSEPEDANTKPKDTEHDASNTKPKAITNVSPVFTGEKSVSPVPPVIPSFQTHLSPKALVSPIQNISASVTNIISPQNSYKQIPYPIIGQHNHTFPTQNPAVSNRFSSILNDKSERIKYFEAKKQKSSQPRTYKEFREARERAQAQEAANKRAADEAEAKKSAEDFKGDKNDTITKKTEESRKEKKPIKVQTTKTTFTAQKNTKKSPVPVETALDKMYRTQNFNSKFPKANTSFKIPKKKTEEKPREEAAGSNEELPKSCDNKNNNTTESNETESITPVEAEKTKTEKQEPKDKIDDYKKQIEFSSSKDLLVIDSNISEAGTTDNSANDKSKHKETFVNEILKNEDDKSAKTPLHKENYTEFNEVVKHTEQNIPEQSNIMDISSEDNKKNSRDPRCRPKPQIKDTEMEREPEKEPEKEKETLQKNFKLFGDIVITSSESEVILKPQGNLTALDKFNKLTQELSPKPQRILRRRNTMVAFESAPLVDKEKLKKANALLFEDVQEEEKRKIKQAEEERFNARRNRNLEEMFKKTDDNCTVSTQNIITGKRRTRATINFNETVNAINVFKHITTKDTPLGNPNNTTACEATTQPVKNTRYNVRVRIKNLEAVVHTKDDKSDDEFAETSSNKGSVKGNKETTAAKTKPLKDAKLKAEESISEIKTNAKPTKKRAAANKKPSNPEDSQAITSKTEVGFKPIQDDEHQNCAVSSTSADKTSDVQAIKPSSSKSIKKESNDDNEPTSTANNKSNNPTPTPEANVQVLNEIVDQILKPNADREHVLGLLGQILSEEKLEVIKSLIESSNRQNEEQESNKEEDTNQHKEVKIEKIKSTRKKDHDEDADDAEEDEDEKPLKPKKVAGDKKMAMPKKKRSELDRLNEDIRDMFICEGVLTATGRRMCTIMGKEVDTENTKKSPKVATTSLARDNEQRNKRKDEKLKPPVNTRPLRRSLRVCKTTDENEDDDNHSVLSRTTEESTDDFSTTADTSLVTDTTPQRKMPVLKPHTPIKIPEEVLSKSPTKELSNKRRSETKTIPKAKKSKTSKLESESEEKESETEADEEDMEPQSNENQIAIRNTNLHWHNQSKYITWCMICEKRIPAINSSLHYKTHHRENYISRMAPVLLQQFKQGKLNQPLFGVKRAQKQHSWFYRCPFCLKYFNTSLPLWLEHFQNHTVEFRYECSKCHRCSNRRLTVSRHIKSCEGATILNSTIKLNVPTVIQAHVCHLCNFIQLKRINLERHYIEQHQMDKKTAELLGYTITLFDVENVECVSEDKAVERENEAWKSIEIDEKVIDIEDDEIEATATNNKNNSALPEEGEREKSIEKQLNNKKVNETKNTEQVETELKSIEAPNEVEQKQIETENITELKQTEEPANKAKEEAKEVECKQRQNKDSQKVENLTNQPVKESTNNIPKSPQGANKIKDKQQPQNSDPLRSQKHNTSIVVNITENETKNNNDFEIIDAKTTVQDIQDELLALAAEAAAKELNFETKDSSDKSSHEQENEATKEYNTGSQTSLSKSYVENKITIETPQSQTTMSDLISSSIDMIYKRADSSSKRKSIGSESSEAKKVCQTASNVFMPTRDENNYSPTIQILAQSIVSIEEEAKGGESSTKNKPITMAERLSQRFKSLQNQNTESKRSTKTSCKENVFEKLINDTVLELEKEKETAASSNSDLAQTPPSNKTKESAFDKLVKETLLDEETSMEKEATEVTKQLPQSLNSTDIITVISDDEDWEDIEITETAPTATTSNSGNMQKSKNKGLFQKFGIFKGNNTKSKKHLAPMVFMPKKKTKEKTPQTTITLSSSPSPITTTTAAVSTKNNTSRATPTTLAASSVEPHLNNSNAHLGFKPVINIIDDLLPDSPCNDPIDLVPELAPLEPLQDLNDISSILDSNLSAVNINAADNQNTIEDALDFISEQQANDKESAHGLPITTTINNITHVGYSVQIGGESNFKFYCLLQNCTFLYSSDSIGLETHFMCEHAQIKWNGYCLMCQAQCFPNEDAGGLGHSITKEIRHMMEKHAKKPQLDLNTDSTQHSTSSSQGSEERPKIKLRRLTGDCLSRATPESVDNSTEALNEKESNTNSPPSMCMLGALLVAKPKPPTKEMPPQPQMPLTEPLLLDNSSAPSPTTTQFTNVSGDFLITSVTSAVAKQQTPLQISSVMSLNRPSPTTTPEQMQMPKISSVRTLAPKAGNLWSQQIEQEHHELVEAAAESLEVSRILANAGRPSTNREIPRTADDSPVIVAETVPLAQAKTGDFVVTQTVSAQYNEFSSTALGFNISIAASTAPNPENMPLVSNAVTSRQYKCMGNSCKFVSRVPVAMSDHLRFHERRNFSNKRDYLACGFCSYCASDVEDYMKHADQFHIINKQGSFPASTPTDTVTSLTKKIQDILKRSSNTTVGQSRSSCQPNTQNQITLQVPDTEEVYLKKLRDTIDEIVAPTGLADDKLYRCVIKNCHTQLTESTFLSHVMFHISNTGGNPNSFVYKCPHCTAQYQRAAIIKAHIKNHARNIYFCYLCEQTSTNSSQLIKHFSEKHWHTSNMFTKELLKPKTSSDGSGLVIGSGYYIAYTQDLTDEEVRKFGEKLILEWQRKKSGSKTHFKSSEIDLLPMSAIFQREINCGECKYKTKVRTNMFRHLQMHKQNPGMANKSDVSKEYSVDPVNPVPCLNSTERFFDKMTNLASSSLVPSTTNANTTTKTSFKIPYGFVDEATRYTCGCLGCNYHTISEDLFRTHLTALHSTAMVYRCTFCNEEVCKRGLTIDRIVGHLRFHGVTIFRCEECNYVHYLRYVVERHINERHATSKVNIVTHERSNEDSVEGTTTSVSFAGKKYKDTSETNEPDQTSITATRSTNNESSVPKPETSSGISSAKVKSKWVCDVCRHRSNTVGQMQTHCQQQHGVKNQYKCAHCNFGSQQLSQILAHIDDKHSGKTREARYMYHKSINTGDELADTRPLWQRNDPTRVRHIRGILMEDEEESEEYRKKLGLSDDVEEDDDDVQQKEGEEKDEESEGSNYILGYEFGCYYCGFKTQIFENLKDQHYKDVHSCQLETAKPFWYRLHRRLCCPECRTFIGNYSELQQHLMGTHKKSRFYAADITMAENDDPSQRILCGYCSFHCANVEHLHRHYLRVQHWPQDIRIDNNDQIMRILALGQSELSYQCTLCADIFPNRVAIVQHACNVHAGEDSFSFRELKNSLIYRCNSCCFTSTTEIDLMRHMIDHYSRFKICHFCHAHQSSFNVCMQHCYAEHKQEIQKFRTIYPFTEIRKFLLQMLIVFPSGLVLNKRNLLNTKYGKTEIIDELYEDIYKISQQPPIPRLSIARLVARKSIEAQQKHVDYTCSSPQDEILDAMQGRTKGITKTKRPMEDNNTNAASLLKPKISIIEGKSPATITKRRTTVDHENSMAQQQQQKNTEFNAPLQQARITKRRRTVAVDRETLFSTNLASSSTNSLLIAKEAGGKKRKTSFTHTNTPPPKHLKETDMYPLNLDMEPFSFYGQKPEAIDLSKVYTKVAIGGIKTPLTIDKFKLLFNIDCQLKLTKCDDDAQTMAYNDYRHIKMPCPASHKLRYN